MAAPRNRHTDADWMELITECRQSGQTDADWCRARNIPLSSFYNAVSRLRKKACAIPETSWKRPDRTLDLTSGIPDVVPIQIEPEKTPMAMFPTIHSQTVTHLDNSHIEILLDKACIKIPNGADPVLIKTVLSAFGGVEC